MKIFPCIDIRRIDEFTIINEPVAPVDLMERAAQKLFEWFTVNMPQSSPVAVFTGPGNNGGDGLALARMLSGKGYYVTVFNLSPGSNHPEEWEINHARILDEGKVPFTDLTDISAFPLLAEDTIIVDAIFGSGLSRPAENLPAYVIKAINSSGCKVVSIDIPSGLFGEDNGSNNPETIIKACFTLSFQFPKLSFMFPENEKYTGKWYVLPIGLHRDALDSFKSPWQMTQEEDIRSILKVRRKFDHKGSFGHGLMVSGSYGKMGAALLSSRASLRTGMGLLTCMIPSCGSTIMHISLPEAMLIFSESDKIVVGKLETGKFNAVGIGPGLGTSSETAGTLYHLLQNSRKPLVIDADALNILSENKEWLKLLPEGTILTPHPLEFERLAGKSSDGYKRLALQQEFSARFKCIVVLKGANTSVSEQGGSVFFNPTGNPGMATAGSGDVLTGMILSLLTQGYSPVVAARTAVYIHGLAADIALENGSEESLIASDIIDNIGNAFRRIRNKKK
jgi:ADP-dependent NAD(P)H-hydrate dehydratase / NAD(P)H-hydrate epimerase